jgi:hypothetical protein
LDYQEIKGNLFEHIQPDVVYANCIAADGKYGAGIAPVFIDQVFHQREQVLKGLEDSQLDGDKGWCLLVDHCAYLITKRFTHGKPTYTSMIGALGSLKTQMEEKNLNKLYMPKIGCGLDKLNWDKVSNLIKEIFQYTDIRITVFIKE